MLFLMQSQVTGSLPADEPVAEACSQLNALFLTAFETGEAMPIPDFSVNNLDVKSDDVCRLLSGQRMFGVPSVIRDPQDATDSTESKTSGRKPTPLLQYLTLQSQDLKNTRPRPTVPKRASLAYALGEGAEKFQRRIKPTPASAQANPEAHIDSDVIEPATVIAPPEFTPAEAEVLLAPAGRRP
jgi:hypothetical protein